MYPCWYWDNQILTYCFYVAFKKNYHQRSSKDRFALWSCFVTAQISSLQCKMAATGQTVWFQTTVNVKPKSRGVHVITDEIERIPELKKYKIGLAHLLLQHTSASICVNECWDSSVRTDMEMMLNRLVPESGPPYRHTLEGPDDMPG